MSSRSLLSILLAVWQTVATPHGGYSVERTLAERLSCPKCNGITYATNNGDLFEIVCKNFANANQGENTIHSVTLAGEPADNFEDCIDRCSKSETCIEALYTPFGDQPEGGECSLFDTEEFQEDFEWLARRVRRASGTGTYLLNGIHSKVFRF
ncbi:hypothetical protein EJ05DRAFT_16487 [Pseudovirgaria hyperparasitica]|uniref:Apple domain-containing protein n=1 Tax=Pseudovirgaria hyperparasitica TaxID=470096 RepID=A0A6A6WKT9_9PEZI|nr:uncharacterized protein EJ05DRAFT_16487 [Pseudovirgaria hyperparasitica]KAF2762820.1 hypothetical protein EJ05DRAFT_16487 [Pseudovirgaria hyperparasitica]